MKKVDKFYKSHRQYALDLPSLMSLEAQSTYTNHPELNSAYYRNSIKAIWFKRKNKKLIVTYGYIWDSSKEQATDPLKYATECSTGRYGGSVLAQWDGKDLWGVTDFDDIVKYKEMLDPLLANYPNIPDGYDGWWEF